MSITPAQPQRGTRLSSSQRQSTVVPSRSSARQPGPQPPKRRRNRNRMGNRSAGPSSSARTFPGGSSYNNSKPYVLENDEFIENIQSSTDFRVRSLSVNPGQSAVFPWLSTMAKNFEKYRFERLEFYYRPRVSGFAEAGQRGQVVMSFDFDAADASPTNKQQMESTFPHRDDMPYKEIILPLKPSDLTPMSGKYVRAGLPPPNTDIKTYDAGVLHVATSGMVSLDAYIGELRVRYRAVLTVPVLEPPAAFTPSKVVATTEGYNNGAISPTALALAQNLNYNPIGVSYNPTTGGIVLPYGQYWIDVGVQFTDCSTVDPNSGLLELIISPELPSSAQQEDYSSNEIIYQLSATNTGAQTCTGRWFWTSSAPSSSFTNEFQLKAVFTSSNPPNVRTYVYITAL